MAANIKQRVSALVEDMSPRTRQWATIGGISAVAVGVLWAAFSMGSSDAKPGATGSPKGTVKPTNVDVMAPGSQVKDVDTWVGKAGKKLDQFESDRAEQQRINREQSDGQATIMRRLAEFEARLKSAPPAEPAKAASAPPATPVPTPAPSLASAKFPPDAALARQGLPPPPPMPTGSRAGMPTGAPAFGGDFGMPAQPALVRVAVGAPAKPIDGSGDGSKGTTTQTLDTFLPVSFTRGILLGGVDAPTGGQAQTNPHPILIRLSDNSVLPNRFRGEYRECFVIAAAYGDISSERAYGRTESLSCVSPDGRALEVKIQGSIFGEDGKVGMRGRLVTKQGQMLANALMAGVVSGIGQGISTANTSYSTTALGTVATSNGNDAMKAGIGSGVGKALDRLAQYYIKLAEQTFPIIEIDAGREIDVVLTKGVRIEGTESAKASPTSLPRRAEPSDRFLKVTDDEE